MKTAYKTKLVLPRRQLSPFWIGICLITLMFSWLTYFRTPIALDFYNFGFTEAGANLNLHDLFNHGYLPGKDFGYGFGWLTLAINRVWFGIFGATPASLRLFIFVFEVIAAASLWRLLSVFMEKRPALIVTLCGGPLFLAGHYSNTTHLLEAILIIQALRLHFQNRKRDALFLTTLCLFLKPAMSYFYGLWLVIAILRAIPKTGSRTAYLTHEFGPALAGGVTLLAASAIQYGWQVSGHLLFPVEKVVATWADGIGFFGPGRGFWTPEGARIGYYVGTAAGLWIIGSIALLLESTSKRRTAPLMLLAYLHLVFILFLFGNASAWAKYFYLLLTAFAVLIQSVKTPVSRRRFTQILCLFLLLAQRSVTKETLARWSTWKHGEETARLWADPSIDGEWKEVLRIVGDKKVAVLSLAGGIEAIVGSTPSLAARLHLEPAVTFQFHHAPNTPVEINRKLETLKRSDWIIVPKDDIDLIRVSVPLLNPWLGPPNGEAKMTREQFPELAFDGAYFRVIDNHAPRGT